MDFRDGGSHLALFNGWTFANMEAIGIATRDGDDRVIGGEGDDYIDCGSGTDILGGQRGDDTLLGGKGEDVIRGGLGKDRLFGGTEADVFVYMRPSEGGDRIGDFAFGGVTDVIRLSSEGFGLAAGALAAGQFQVAAADEALTAEVRLIYDTGTGRLSFDRDGSGSASAILLAVLPTGLALTLSEFEIV